MGRTRHLVDLQLRGYPKGSQRGPRSWATLYCGLTKYLDVHEKDGQFRLAGRGDQWQAEWEQYREGAYWKRVWPEIDDYLDASIRAVAERFTREGEVQYMLCTRASSLFSVVDREAVVGFASTAEREATYERFQKPLAAAIEPDPEAPWFVAKKFGGELDVLAVDPRGRLLVMEVKPASSVSGIAWAPLQATFYAELFRAWAEQEKENAVDIIESMLRQRVDLRLTGDPRRRLTYPLEIVPVVAIGGEIKSDEALSRLKRVRDSLSKHGCGWPNLEVWAVQPSVERRHLPLD